MKTYLSFLIAFLTFSNSSYALESFIGKVTMLEPTYIPSAVAFMMDSGNTTCPAGHLLRWSNGDIDNTKLIYNTLMTALVNKTYVKFHFADGDTTCTGKYLHLLSN